MEIAVRPERGNRRLVVARERWRVPDLAQVVEIVIEHLDPVIAPIGDVDAALVVDGDAVRLVELTRARRLPVAHHLHDVTVPVELVDMRVDVAVADEDVALRVEGHVGRLEEVPGARWRYRGVGWDRWFAEPLEDRLVAAPKRELEPAVRAELHDKIGAVVDEPDIVVAVHAHRVGPRLRVEVPADLPDEASVGPKLEELRAFPLQDRCARSARPGVHEYVALRVQCHAGDLSEIQVVRQLERFGHFERNLGDWRLLSHEQELAAEGQQRHHQDSCHS